jgi:hypothetical protein
MVVNATFNIFSAISEYPEKPPDLSQVTDKTLSHNVVHLALCRSRTHISGDRHRLQKVVVNLTTIRSLQRRPPQIISIIDVIFNPFIQSNYISCLNIFCALNLLNNSAFFLISCLIPKNVLEVTQR